MARWGDLTSENRIEIQTEREERGLYDGLHSRGPEDLVLFGSSMRLITRSQCAGEIEMSSMAENSAISLMSYSFFNFFF